MTTPSLLELDEVLRRHAWNILKRRSSFLRRAFLDEEDYVCEVDWTSLSIDHKLAKFVPKEKPGTLIETNWGKVITGSKWVSLWSCDFDNKADSKQTHTFKGSRDTTTWVDVDLDQGYTIDKQVEVLPNWRAHAQLLAKEDCHAMEFEIRSTLFNPKGVVPVSFLRKSDRRAVYVVEIENFQEAFRLEEEGGSAKPEEKPCIEILAEKSIDCEGQEHSASYTQIITKGSCICLSWSDQKVDIKTSPLSVDESTLDGDGNPSVANNISEKQFIVKTY